MELTGIEGILEVGLQALVKKGGRGLPGDRWLLTVRGWRDGEYIILDFPPNAHIKGRLKPNEYCVVQFLREGDVFAFTTRVDSSGHIQRRELRLAWPQKTEKLSLRRHERVEISLPCRVKLPDGKEIAGTLCDISSGGCSVLVKADIEKDTVITVKFSPLPGRQPKELQCLIRSVVDEQSHTRAGCQFEEMDKETAYAVEFFVATTLDRLRHETRMHARVLVLEDDADALKMLREPLEASGIEVAVAPCLVDAFYRLRLSPPDVLVLKGKQPDLAVDAIYRILRQTPGCEKLPIVIYGEMDKETAARAKKAGARALAGDPGRVVQALEEVLPEDVLMRKRVRPPAESPAAEDKPPVDAGEPEPPAEADGADGDAGPAE